MKSKRLPFDLKASAATLALLCALGSHGAAALPLGLPENCTFIYPDGWRCCWNDGTCSELYPSATTAPSPASTPAPTPMPTVAPSTTSAPGPAATTTGCPTSVSSTMPGIGIPGFSHLFPGGGLFTTSTDTAALECGTDTWGNVIPCPPKKMGDITKNCVLTGFDPPPMLRSHVAANIRFPTDPIPFISMPAVGNSVLAAGASMNTLTGSCQNPHKLDASGNMVENGDPSIKSRIKCPVKKGIPGLPLNSVTRPAPTPCPVGPGLPDTCKDADAAPEPPGTAPDCSPVPAPAPGDPPTPRPDGPVPNLTTGCTTDSIPGMPIPYSYCHKNLSSVIQSCPSGTCVDAIPGMACGGAIPLLDPVPWTAAESYPACPPDDWCIDPARSALLRDGSIHLSQGTAPGVYNITIAMGQNNMLVGSTARVYTMPAMGLCKEFFTSAVGSLVLSEGYSYLISPASMVDTTTGLPCFGPLCNFNMFKADPSTFVSAPYPINYSTNPYRPYGTIAVVKPELYPTSPPSYIPYINLATGTQVYLSLSRAGSITLPEGATFVTPTGGLVAIPKQGWVATRGDGTTIELSGGSRYMLDATNMKTVTGTCFLQLTPPNTGTQITTCATTPPPLASMDPTVPNVAIPILTTAVGVPEGTPLPPFTKMDYDNACPPPPTVTLEGSIIEPSWCVPPAMFNPTTGKCVIPKPVCGAGLTLQPYTGPIPPAAGDGVKCTGTLAGYCATTIIRSGSAYTIHHSSGNEGSGANYTYFCGSMSSSTLIGFCNCSNDYDSSTCYSPAPASPSGSAPFSCSTIPVAYNAPPIVCNMPDFIWCPATQACTYGVLGSNIAALCGNTGASSGACAAGLYYDVTVSACLPIGSPPPAPATLPCTGSGC